VEFLSRKNELFLKELKTKDYYAAYKQQNEELTKLREAHTLLINMIGTKDITVKKHEGFNKSAKKSQSSNSLGGLLTGGINSQRMMKKFSRASMPPLRRLLSCQIERNESEREAGNNPPMESEPFETMESV
jgi:hypothetical protein